MTGVKISALAAAGTLSGSETVPVVQSGTTKGATAAQIATYANGVLTAVANSTLATMAARTFKANVTSGSATPTDATVAQVTALLGVGNLVFVATGVNFNSANTDNAITIALPTGYTRYHIAQVRIVGASASLTTATCGVFSATAAGGTAIVASGTAITVSTASENTANNAQSLTIAAGGATQTLNFATLYFRVQTAQGSAATGSVVIALVPIP
jgi:hypothetical protein